MTEREALLRVINRLIVCIVLSALLVLGISLLFLNEVYGLISLDRQTMAEAPHPNPEPLAKNMWQAPDTTSVPLSTGGDLIKYGRELVAHTSVYLGPKGKIKQISNGMNCQNCHLKAGTVPFGNNYGAVSSSYPKYRNRSGTVEGFEKRVNDCIERSLNGQPLDTGSREMQAMVAYIKWVGHEVQKGEKPLGFGLVDLPLMERAADPLNGRLVYAKHCRSCHGREGEGKLAENGLEYTYPPLTGENSYNTGAGLYRISRFAAFVKANMPYGVSYDAPVLSDEEAWDVAAYVNSMPRPEKDLSGDWPDISKKPFDHPFGPYADEFPEVQHKFGPFGPIVNSSIQ